MKVHGKHLKQKPPYKVLDKYSVEMFCDTNKIHGMEFWELCSQGEAKDHERIKKLLSKIPKNSWANCYYADYLGRVFNSADKLEILNRNLEAFPDTFHTKLFIALELVANDSEYEYNTPKIPYEKNEMSGLSLTKDINLLFLTYLIERSLYNEDIEYAKEIYTWILSLEPGLDEVAFDFSDPLINEIYELFKTPDGNFFDDLEGYGSEEDFFFSEEFDMRKNLPLLYEFSGIGYEIVNTKAFQFLNKMIFEYKDITILSELKNYPFDESFIEELNKSFSFMTIELRDEEASESISFDFFINYIAISAHFHLFENLPIIFEFMCLPEDILDDFVTDENKLELVKPLYALCKSYLSPVEVYLVHRAPAPRYSTIALNVLGSLYENDLSLQPQIIQILNNFYLTIEEGHEDSFQYFVCLYKTIRYFKIIELEDMAKIIEDNFPKDLDYLPIMLLNNEEIISKKWHGLDDFYLNLKEEGETEFMKFVLENKDNDLPFSNLDDEDFDLESAFDDDEDEDFDDEDFDFEDDDFDFEGDDVFGEGENIDPGYLYFMQNVMKNNLMEKLEQAKIKADLNSKNLTLEECLLLNSSLNSDNKEEEIKLLNNKIGRNDPCPCGSGEKYKKCCLNKLN